MSAQTRFPLYPRLAVTAAIALCSAMLWASVPHAGPADVSVVGPAPLSDVTGSESVQDKTLDGDLGIKLLLHRHHAPVSPVSAAGHTS